MKRALGNISLRIATEEDLPSINVLYNEVFGGQRSLNYCRWKFSFLADCCGFPPIVVAQEGASYVGMYAGIWRSFLVDGRSRFALLAVDNVISQGFRGSGLQRMLFDAWLNELDRQKVPFVLGFPGPKNFDICVHAFQYQPLSNNLVHYKQFGLSRITAKLKTLLLDCHTPWAADGSKSLQETELLTEGEGIRIAAVSGFSESSVTILQTASRDYPISVNRSKSYLDWRYVAQPGRKVVVLQLEEHSRTTAVVLLGVRRFADRPIGVLYELAGEPSEYASQRLLTVAETIVKQSGADGIYGVLPSGSWFATQLQKAGYGVDYNEEYRPVVLDVSMGSAELLGSGDSWYLTLGDTDW